MTKQELKCYIKDNLKCYRKKRGYTQEELAEIAEISSAYCAQIETGVRIPTVYVLKKLADALDVPIDALVRENKDQAKQQELEYLLQDRSAKQLELREDLSRVNSPKSIAPCFFCREQCLFSYVSVLPSNFKILLPKKFYQNTADLFRAAFAEMIRVHKTIV